MILNGQTKSAGVIGWPIAHSLSPRLHGFWIEKAGLNAIYMPLPVEPSCLREAVLGMKACGFCGFNATLPHKESLLAFGDTVSALAKRARAANTVVFRGDEIFVTNTDIFGFTENLKRGGFILPQTKTIAAILGAGGAARAIVVALQEMGFCHVRIVNRDRRKAEKIAEDMPPNCAFEIYDWEESGKALDGADLLVNTTSLGMSGQPPLEMDLSPLPATACVTDAVYTPLETDLLKQARRRGLKAIDGLGMLLYQAQPAFEAFFGFRPEVTDELRSFVLEGL